jgi:coiled-coil domain-containing protein 151
VGAESCQNTAKSKVEEIKYSGTGSLGSRRIVDEFESHLSEANAKCERNKQKYERVAKILINVKAGIEHLVDKLEIIKIEQPPIMMSDDTVVDVLEQGEKKLLRLVQWAEAERAAAAEREVKGDGKVRIAAALF